MAAKTLLLEYLRHQGDFAIPDQAPPRPSLILLDLNMPQIDGRQTLKVIKSDPHLKNIPVVILTTSKEKHDVDFCMGAGACDFITKPVDFEEWVSTVTTLTSANPSCR